VYISREYVAQFEVLLEASTAATRPVLRLAELARGYSDARCANVARLPPS
jgi:hypothetical protein